MNKPVSEEDQLINEVIEGLRNLANDAEYLGNQLYYIKTHYPHRIDEIRTELKGLFSRQLENNLLSLVKEEILPEMVPDTSKVSVILKEYPLDVQKKLYIDQETIQVYDSEIVRELNAFDMSNIELDMVFDKQKATIRDLKQQRTWFNAKNKTQKKTKTWRIVNIGNKKAIKFTQGTILTIDELKIIIRELEE